MFHHSTHSTVGLSLALMKLFHPILAPEPCQRGGASFSDPNVKELRGGKMTRIHKFRHLLLILLFASVFATKLHRPFHKMEPMYISDLCCFRFHMGVSKKRGIPKCIAYNRKLIEVDDLRVPLFFGNTHIDLDD